MQQIYNISLNGTKQSIESQDRAVMLELLGWYRGGKTNHLPDDIIGVIKDFTFFDTRTKAYREHLEKKRTELDMLWVLDEMMYEINDGRTCYETCKYEVEYNRIISTSTCCYRCGDFIPTGVPHSINARCECEPLTYEEMMEFSYKREEEKERRDELSNKTYAEYMEEMKKERLEEDWY